MKRNLAQRPNVMVFSKTKGKALGNVTHDTQEKKALITMLIQEIIDGLQIIFFTVSLGS